jgi:hypothetical protein
MPAMSQRRDQPVQHQFGDLSSAALETPGQSTTAKSPRTSMQQDGFNTPLTRTPLAYRRKPSDGIIKKRVADDDKAGEHIGAVIKKVKSKEYRINCCIRPFWASRPLGL